MSLGRCELSVAGLDCPTEVAALRGALDGQPGVSELGFDLIQGTMTVVYDPAHTDPDRLIALVEKGAGLKASLLDSTEGKPETRNWSRLRHWAATGVAGLALLAGVVMDSGLGWSRAALVAYGLASLVGLAVLLPRAFASLRRGRLDMYVLMSIAVLGAIGLRRWDEAATIAFLFGLSEALEALSLERARRAVTRLLELAPEEAERVGEDGRVELIPARSLTVGDRVRVRAGERIPADGRIAAGRSRIDQQAITGESVPVFREVGDEVYGGTVNGDGTLEVEVTRAAGESVAARIAQQVRAAQTTRAPVERLIERFAAWYTPLVVSAALLVMVGPPLVMAGTGGSADWSEWFLRGLVILVIACPCALVIGTPVAIVSATTCAARHGILVKGGPYLEVFGRLRTLAMDKTGTLTQGVPDVVAVVAHGEDSSQRVLRVAAAVGDRGGHILGRAIARHARDLELEVPEAMGYQAVPGLGATAEVEQTSYHVGSHRFLDEQGLCQADFHEVLSAAEGDIGTSVAVSTSDGPLGWIRLEDRPRTEAASVLAELKRLGVRPVMLTGDNAATARGMAAELGLDDFRAELLPEDKARAVRELDQDEGPAGMVGDGVNDAPALAAARVSVTLGGIGTAAALETADVVLMADDLTGLPWLVRHSRRTLALIRVNIAIALGSKLLVLGLAAAGLAGFWMAIGADVGVSLLVVLNALRLLRAS